MTSAIYVLHEQQVRFIALINPVPLCWLTTDVLYTTSVLLSGCVTSVFFNGATALSEPGPPRYPGFTITLRHTTLGTGDQRDAETST